MVTNQLIHQESGTSNLHHFTSNPGPLLPKPALWFHLSWVDLIIMTLIMSMYIFNLQNFQLNITMNLFQIRTPLRSNQLMMMKWTIYFNCSNHNMIMILWIMNSILFRINWWRIHIQNDTQSLLCYFINKEKQMLQSQMAYHIFQ